MTLTSKLSLLVVCTLALAACSDKPNNSITGDGGGGFGGQKVDKDADPVPSIAGLNDLFTMALSDLSWDRRSYSLAKNPPITQMKDDCVIHFPIKKGAVYLKSAFDCTRPSDESDSATDRIFKLGGLLAYVANGNNLSVNGNLVRQVWSNSKNKLIALGTFTRGLRFSPLATTSSYRAQTQTTYKGEVARASLRVPEVYQIDVDGSFTAPLKLASGTTLAVTYSPEHVPLTNDAKASKFVSQSLKLTATTEVVFDADDVCARPLGTFSWTLDQVTTFGDGTTAKTTSNGTLTTAATGLTLVTAPASSTDRSQTTVVGWGLRCLEK